jgi:transposase
MAVTGRFHLTDTQWALLEPLLPTGKKPGRPPNWTKRQLIDGIRWRTRVGSPGGTCRCARGHGRRYTACSAAGSATAPGDRSWSGWRARADAAGLITWNVSVDTTIARAHQHAAGARKRGTSRPSHPAAPTRSSRPTTRWGARGWLDHQAASGLRTGPPPAVGADHRRTARRQPTVCRRPRPDPGASARSGTAPYAPGSGVGGQGLQLQTQPGLPAPTRDPVHHPGQGRPGRSPAQAGFQGWPAARVRLRALQAAPRRRVRHQPARTTPRRGDPLRQARRALGSHHPHRHERHLAPLP